MKKKLSLQEAVQAGQIIYTLNTEREASLLLAKTAGLFDEGISCTRDTSLFMDAQEHFLWEWRAFVHSAVLYGLAEYSPAVVVIEYLRMIQDLLKSQDSLFNEELGKSFVDEPFQAYAGVILEKRVNACPQIFFKRYLDFDLNDTTNELKINTTHTQCITVISSSMAMLFAASLDAFEKMSTHSIKTVWKE